MVGYTLPRSSGWWCPDLHPGGSGSGQGRATSRGGLSFRHRREVRHYPRQCSGSLAPARRPAGYHPLGTGCPHAAGFGGPGERFVRGGLDGHGPPRGGRRLSDEASTTARRRERIRVGDSRARGDGGLDHGRRWWSSGPGRPGSPPPTSWPRPAIRWWWSSRTPWSGGSAARSSATAGASTSAATGSSPRCRRWRSSGTRSSPDEDFLLRPRMSRIFYDGKFYDYPIKLGQRPLQPGHGRGVPLRALLPVGADPAAEGPDHPRGLHRLQLRVAPLPPLLQDLQREGLGRVGLGDLGRLGGPADQGHVAVERGVGADPRSRWPASVGTGPSR